MAVVRELFSSPEVADGLERDEAVRELSRRLGFVRVGPIIRATLERELLAAARRGIIETRGGRLCPCCKSIGDYRRDFLKHQLLAAMGRRWIERREAAVLLARRLGFRRTGAAIQRVVKTLISGLIRQGRLEVGREVIRVRNAEAGD